MELAAILAAVRDIPKNATATIYTDSLLSVNILTRKWKAKKNRDLVQAIRRAAENRHVKFQWIRGHNGHVLNERADQLANAARLHQRR